MKKTTLVLLMVSICLGGFAQGDAADPHISHYVFDNFVAGLVKKKAGQAHLSLNYNTLTEEMIFLKDTQRLAIANLDEIDTVYVGGKVFVPVKNAFFEKATNTVAALYVQNKSTVMPPGSNVGYGMTTQSGSVSDLSAVISPSQVYKLSLPEGFRVVLHEMFWLNKDGKFIPLTGAKKIQSAFPSKKDAIKTFIEENNIKFDSRGDMVKLVVFCNQQG